VFFKFITVTIIMAMLAEPRRRQRIGLNPRGKFFMEDEDNKGRALLQKLGWEVGKGLGRENQGMNAPIQPKIQMDSKGLGFDIKSNPWVAHTEEFSQLLESLTPILPNSDKSNDDEKIKETPLDASDNDNNDESTPRKLEKMSKSSRSRIHYHKFIKSKDVSNFSNTDLQCIFGRPAESLTSSKNKKKNKKSKIPQEEEKKDFKEGEEEVKVKIETPESVSYEEDGVKVINRGSMSDYFKAKMAERRLNALNGNLYNNNNKGVHEEIKVEIKNEEEEDDHHNDHDVSGDYNSLNKIDIISSVINYNSENNLIEEVQNDDDEEEEEQQPKKKREKI